MSRVIALLCAAGLAPAAPAQAQSISGQLATLFTGQGTTPTGATDPRAADRSRETLVALFGIELASAPLASGSGGFVYRLNPTIGAIERTSDSFGAFYTERALRIGRRQLALGLVAQNTFPLTAVRAAGSRDPFAVDTLHLELSSRSLTARATYGVTDALDVGLAVPFVQTSFSGSRITVLDGRPVFDIVRSGRASGLGDTAVTVRYRVTGGAGSGVAVGSDVRLPTGSAENLLGTGRASYRGHLIATLDRGSVDLSGNAGVGLGGASDEIFWAGAVTWAAAPRVTVVSEVFGRRLDDLHRASPVYQPHSVAIGAESMRWLPDDTTATHIGYLLGGVKWNVGDTMLVGANVLVRLGSAGLRARVTPSLTLEYAFAR